MALLAVGEEKDFKKRGKSSNPDGPTPHAAFLDYIEAVTQSNDGKIGKCIFATSGEEIAKAFGEISDSMSMAVSEGAA